MPRSLATQVMALLLMVVLPLTILFADASGALLRSNGPVTVNGKTAPSSVALFAGDKISTAGHGVASLMTAGSILTLSSGTSLTYGTNTVEMGCGQLAVTALQRGLTAKVRNLQVSPTSDESTYEILHSAEKLTITVRAGSAMVEDGQQKMMLAAGKEMSFASPGECNDPVGKAKPEPPARGFHMTNGKIALLAGAGAGAIAAGVVIAEHGNKHCVSPDGSPACKCSNTNPNKCQ
jgi:hypothetical protein